jgi:uncharacterized protein
MRFHFRTIVGVFLALLLSLPVVGYSQTELKVGTSGPGSVAYVWVSTLASVLDQFKAPVRIRVAGGVFDVEAIRTMEKGEKGLDASLVTGSTLANAVFSKGPFKGEKVKELRAIFPLGLSPLQIVAAEKSKITSLNDLSGKRISAGAAGGGPDLFTREFFAKMFPNLKVQIVPMAFSAAAQALSDGKIDAFFTFGAAPYPAIVEASSLMKLNYLSVGEEVRNKWFKDNPQHHTMVIPAGAYKDQTKEMITFGHVAHLLAPGSMPKETAYALAKQLLTPAFKDALIKATETWAPAYEGLANKVYFEDLASLGVPFHTGAAQAFKEAGYDLSKNKVTE